MKKMIEVCEMCYGEDCDGVIYETIDKHRPRKDSKELIRFDACKSIGPFVMYEGKPYYRQIVDGEFSLFPLRLRVEQTANLTEVVDTSIEARGIGIRATRIARIAGANQD